MSNVLPWTKFEMQLCDLRVVEFTAGDAVLFAKKQRQLETLSCRGRYGRSTPPGEPIHLTDAQLREWRRE
jgi:hypothetical protein